MVLNSQQIAHKRTLRNVIIFAVVTFASGWLGYSLDRAMGNPPTQSLGQLLWLVLPMLTGLLLRAFAGDGWKDAGLWPAFKHNAAGYLVSLLIYPVVGILVVAIGGLLGFVSWANLSWARLLAVFTAGFAPALIKNIFEECAWRGYLTPKVKSLISNDYLGHVIVGMVWAGWHIPYWLFVLDRALIPVATAQEMAVFIAIAVLNLIVAAIAYGELRLITGSVWPVVILHAIGNALIEILSVEGFIQIKAGTGFLVSPGHQSFLTLAFFLLIGIGLHRWRIKNQAY